SSDDKLVLATLFLDEEKTGLKIMKERNQKWIHLMLKKRKLEKKHCTLFNDLLKYDMYYQYFRMSECKFYDLLKLIEPILQNQNISFREVISPTE
ncbi:hypothetical protein EAI_06725, partial [Harpegnathos saltator]